MEDPNLVVISGSVGGISFGSIGQQDYSVKEVLLNESLLNPGLQTIVTFHSYIYTQGKNLDSFKGGQLQMNLSSRNGSMSVAQKIYRLDNREFMPSNVSGTEEFTLHACDQSLLNDAKSLVSKSWKCESPDSIVSYVLKSCAGVRNTEIDSAQPSRDYIAENIHPFQVVAQQANVALDGEDPSFLHYMTYKNNGTHHFKSLKKLCNGSPKATFYYGDAGPNAKSDGSSSEDYKKNVAIHFVFPCDFDLLSDILNGVDESGQNINSLTTINPLNMATQLLGPGGGGGGMSMNSSCGIGSGNAKASMTNKGTAKEQGGCETDVEKHLLKRQARMGLLEKDKVALRITTPFRPDLHVGDLIKFEWNGRKNSQKVYGSGTYLISSLTHKIMMGGFSTTTMDCVAQTAGGGIV